MAARPHRKPAYAVALLRNVRMGPEIVGYLDRIDETLAPFGGRFVVHGPAVVRVEGRWPDGDLIIIGFPDMDRLEAWYASKAYAAIKRLRTDNADGAVIFVEGVPQGHRAPDVLTANPLAGRRLEDGGLTSTATPAKAPRRR
jgi:uncharacterized protein (DUF1330 family)